MTGHPLMNRSAIEQLLATRAAAAALVARIDGMLLRKDFGLVQPIGVQQSPGSAPSRVAALRLYLKARRARSSLFDANLFADPAWDILLDLYLANEEQRRVCVSSACIAAAVPSTTALRWITRLETCGLVEREPDRSDARRSFLRLAGSAHHALTAWIDAHLLCLPGGEHGASRPPRYHNDLAA